METFRIGGKFVHGKAATADSSSIAIKMDASRDAWHPSPPIVLMERLMDKLIRGPLEQKREALLRKREVLRLLGISNSTFYGRIKAGELPSGVPIGPRLKAWPASE